MQSLVMAENPYTGGCIWQRMILAEATKTVKKVSLNLPRTWLMSRGLA